jgi:hypothetical protein
VCGAGCAGLGASLAAARGGANTILIERAGFAGGIITCVGLPFFDGIAHISDGSIMNRGIGFELYARMTGLDEKTTHLETHNPTINNTERFKLLTDEMLLAEGDRMKLLYHSVVADVRVVADRIEAVYVANKAGLVEINPRMVVDCTGDADVAFFADVPTEKKSELQPMTLHFRIGNVHLKSDSRQKCREALVRAHERGDLPMFYGPGLVTHYGKNEVYMHATRVPADGSDPEDLTRAEIQGRKDSWTIYEAWKKDVPGFEDSYFMMNYPYIGVRETRRIIGHYVLSEKDIAETKSFDDAIATGCWYLDQHPNRATPGAAQDVKKIQPDPYDIPYRSLIAQEVENLFVAGRCHSATQLAASSTRVTVTAMAMGEAAGTAAAMAAKRKLSAIELKGTEVRTELESRGAGPIG